MGKITWNGDLYMSEQDMMIDVNSKIQKLEAENKIMRWGLERISNKDRYSSMGDTCYRELMQFIAKEALQKCAELQGEK